MSNEALGYLLTWTTYGTWLPGDERGWIDKTRGDSLPSRGLEISAALRLAHPPVRLDSNQRAIVERAVHDHCRFRDWGLFVGNCRTNHVHVVVAGSVSPDTMMRQLKAWSSRRLNEAVDSSPDQWWTTNGSKRHLNNEESLETAILYVRDGQDGPRRR